MKICAISDLHGFLPDKVPKCDVLVIAGDICPLSSHAPSGQLDWLWNMFNPWLAAQPARKIVGVAGNHDFILESNPDIGYELAWTYLCNEYAYVDDLLFWGTPMSNQYGSWAFMDEDSALYRIYNTIPVGVDVVVTHGPPFGYGDMTEEGEHVGSRALCDILERIHPRVTFTGHIHEARGAYKLYYSGNKPVGDVWNVSMLNRRYDAIEGDIPCYLIAD